MSKKIYLLAALLGGSWAATASQIPCGSNTLDNVLGNYAVCGSMTFDFTSGFYVPGGGAALAASDIIVTFSYMQVHFAVTPGAGGAFATTGTGNGYSTFEISYSASIDAAYAISGMKVRANNVHFDNNNGGADSADALKTVLYGVNPDDPPNPYAYSMDAFAGVDTSGGGGPVNFSSIVDSTDLMPPTISMLVDDVITLNPTGDPGESIESVDNIFVAPEPVTLLSMGTALVALGMIRRRNRNAAR